MAALGRYPLPWTGDEGYKKAEVTGGGVALGEIDPRTMTEEIMRSETARPDPLDGFPIVIELPVAWADMDAFGHVNNTVYFRYFESARIAFLEAIDFAEGGAGGGVGAILASTHCRFRRPLTYPDMVRVGTRAAEVGEDRFGMDYVVVSTALDEVAAEGGAVVVAYDYDVRRKAPLPDAVRDRMDRL